MDDTRIIMWDLLYFGELCDTRERDFPCMSGSHRAGVELVYGS